MGWSVTILTRDLRRSWNSILVIVKITRVSHHSDRDLGFALKITPPSALRLLGQRRSTFGGGLRSIIITHRGPSLRSLQTRDR